LSSRVGRFAIDILCLVVRKRIVGCRDEGLHTDFACQLYKLLHDKCSAARVQQIVSEAVEIEKHFVCGALPVALIGMNSHQMSEYIEFVADRLLLELGCEKLYNTTNPFPFMEQLSLQGKTNFFERRVGDYQKAGVADGASGKIKHELAFDADF
jgi:ribonucleoside-diphosphate reductase subunit M2